MKWLQQNIKNITLILAVIVLIAIGVFIYIIVNPTRYAAYTNFRETVLGLATAATVFATLLLAFATFSLVDSSDKQENHRKKELLLREIIDWAISAANGDFESELQRTVQTINALELLHKINHEESEKYLSQVFGRNKYIITIAESVDKELGKSVKELDKKLNELSKKMINSIAMVSTNQAYADFYLGIFEAANVVIEKAATLL